VPPIHALPDAPFTQELRMYNGTPDEILQNHEVMELMLPVLRADFAVVETYRYVDGPPLTCALSAYGGASDPTTSRDDLDGWSRHTRAEFDVTVFPGDHFYMEQSRLPLLRRVARVLGQLPSAARAGSPP
jgi:medium-chain acyl-[acyl-carrier-protein] hydrolase